MSRPVDWTPLATHDPVPGDPDAVVAMARRHGDLATELEAQARSLRQLSTAEGWDSDAGRVFASSAQDLAGQLDRARRRYSVVAEALSVYAPKLREAQAEADAALKQAIAAQATVDGLRPHLTGNAPATTLVVGQTAGQHGRQGQLDLAGSDLQRARNRLRAAQQSRDGAGRTAQRRIQDAISHDGLKDGLWDRIGDGLADGWHGFANWFGHNWDSFTSWVHEHAGVLKWIADKCSTIATVLSVIAIVISFIPVLNVLAPFLLAAAAALTVIALVCHLLLVASGDGSWVDVGIDLIALATFGMGSTAGGALRATRLAMRPATTFAARTATRQALRTGALRGQIEQASRILRSRTASAAAKRGARRTLAQVDRRARRQAARQTERAVADAMRAKAKLPQGFAYLEGKLTDRLASTQALRSLAPGDARVQALAAQADRFASKARASNLVGTVTDLSDKAHLFDPVKPVVQFGRYAGRS